jgi:MscS family membrane protein
VRFLRLGASSLDVEVFAYILAGDWNRFLEIQEELLLRILVIVEGAGTAIAFPSQTVHFADNRLPVPVSAIGGRAGPEGALPGGAPMGRLVP